MNFLKRKRNEDGVTMIEMVVSVAITLFLLTSVTYAVVGLVKTSNILKENITETVAVTQIRTAFEKDIEESEYIKLSSDGTRIDVEIPDGTCRAWAISGNKIYKTASYGPIKQGTVSGWTQFYDNNVTLPSGSTSFINLSGNRIEYAFKLKYDNVKGNSVLKTTSVLRPNANCW